MPKKRSPKKIDPETLKLQFEAWKNDNEAKAWDELITELPGPEISLTTDDITENWDRFFAKLFKFYEIAKVPKKSKAPYEHKFIRTMFFQKTEEVTVNGVVYQLTRMVNQETFKGKTLLVEISNAIKGKDNLNENDYIQEKKNLIKKLSEFDKYYIKYIKGAHLDVEKIIQTAIEPLKILIEANYNLSLLYDQMKPNTKDGTIKEIPPFRLNAVTDVFVLKMDELCKILKANTAFETNSIIAYNTRILLNRYKIKNWQSVPPFNYFISKLKKHHEKLEAELLNLHKLGEDHYFYELKKNDTLVKIIEKLLLKDMTCQVILGDELKRDQLVFLYSLLKAVYESPLKSKLVGKAIDPKVLSDTIPRLGVFRTLVHIYNIRKRKIEDAKEIKEEKKEEKIQKVESPDLKKTIRFGESSAKRDEKKEKEKERERIEKEKEKKRLDIEKYGREYIWENFINPQYFDKFMKASELVDNINPHVIEDIDDYIIISGLCPETSEGKKQLNELIEKQKKEREESLQDPSKSNTTKIELNIEKMRPPYCWNLFINPECEFYPLAYPHKIKYTANPFESYIDNRIIDFMKIIDELTFHLANHEKQNWDYIVTLANKIFVSLEKKKAKGLI